LRLVYDFAGDFIAAAMVFALGRGFAVGLGFSAFAFYQAGVDRLGLGIFSPFLCWHPSFGDGRALDDYAHESPLHQQGGDGAGLASHASGEHYIVAINYVD
jgi:hypothetical protein